MTNWLQFHLTVDNYTLQSSTLALKLIGTPYNECLSMTYVFSWDHQGGLSNDWKEAFLMRTNEKCIKLRF
jgi:hypothetical protein